MNAFMQLDYRSIENATAYATICAWHWAPSFEQRFEWDDGSFKL